MKLPQNEINRLNFFLPSAFAMRWRKRVYIKEIWCNTTMW